jgi:LPS O-antigen subunit length determinant protein (WzzB/FepE family)
LNIYLFYISTSSSKKKDVSITQKMLNTLLKFSIFIILIHLIIILIWDILSEYIERYGWNTKEFVQSLSTNNINNTSKKKTEVLTMNYAVS